MASQPPGKRSISKSLFSIIGSFQFWLVIFLSAVTKGMNFIPVLVLGQLVEFVSGSTGSVLSDTFIRPLLRVLL